MDNFKDVEAAAGRRMKDIAKALGADAEQMARRQVAQHIVDLETWTAAMGPAYYIVKGGLAVPNEVRPTDDADIQSARAYTEQELLNGFGILADLLRKDGVDLKSWRVRHIEIGYGDPITRVEWQATYGGIRANSHVDISTGFGRDAFPDPKDVHREDHPGMHPRLPGFTVRTQPMETALAEKWIAVATQPSSDLRMKSHADIVLLHSQDVDLKKLGEEIMRVLRYRGMHPNEFSRGIHEQLQRGEILRRAAEWERVRAARPNMRSFAVDEILGSIAHTYRNGVYAAFVRERDKTALADFRRGRAERRHSATAPAAAPEASNVIAFRR